MKTEVRDLLPEQVHSLLSDELCNLGESLVPHGADQVGWERSAALEVLKCLHSCEWAIIGGEVYYERDGRYGKDVGVFEWIIDGTTITHRVFMKK